MPHVWHLLYVGVPPSGGDNPHGLKETFVLVQLPADVSFIGAVARAAGCARGVAELAERIVAARKMPRSTFLAC